MICFEYTPSARPSESPESTSGTSPVVSNHQSLPSYTSPYVNITHIELFHHLIDTEGAFIIDDFSKDLFTTVLRHAFSAPFLMNQLLASASLHLSVCRNDKSQFYEDESARLQAEALTLFNGSIKIINTENVIPAFIFSSMLGLCSFSRTFSQPYHSLEIFLDDFIQSIRLLRGVWAILSGWWEYVRSSDISILFKDALGPIERADDVSQHFEQLLIKIAQCTHFESPQSAICQDAIRKLLHVYNSSLSSNLKNGNSSPRMVTSWPMIMSTEYADLLTRRDPLALIVLSYFTVLLHKCKTTWIDGNSGKTLLGALENNLGEDWKDWIEWPRSMVYSTG